ncbi:MAG: DNA mismatch repair endonuclease MutL [Clostridia bacterium]|nr:DNA mismatch repair endonuclease MutL [Clostridia bacterium]
MGRINLLGFDVANLIAAGEVVDRPSSVVKELLENAIDSGADAITVEIKKGGTAFIRITDNGCGIEYDDLPVAILRHATSKIKDQTDLEAIMTLGFRGEALAAISSVSKVRIMSKQRESSIGGFLECHGGEVISHMQTGCADGTTVIVEDLFYNVPARKKFLKKDVTETGAITGVVEKVALSKPDISFRYIIDGEVKYVTSGDGSLSNTIYALLGREITKQSMQVSREESGVKIDGFISTPEFVRSNRNLENFYINSRYVKSKTASAAIEQAYQSYIPSDKFPFCVLNIEIDPKTVDVNVHPSKLEVKFSNERLIFEAVYYAVRSALSNNITRPELYKENDTSLPKSTPSVFPVYDKEAPKAERMAFDSKGNIGTLRSPTTLSYDSVSAPKSASFFEVYNTAKNDTSPYKKTLDAVFGDKKQEIKAPIIDTSCEKTPQSNIVEIPKYIEKNETVSVEKTVPDYKIIGEAFNSYVIAELGETMYLIDKHAAHERIMFEQLKETMKSATPSSQMLLIPLEVHLTSEEKATVCEWEEDIRKTGFGFEIDDTSVVKIYEIPSGIEQSAAADMLITFASRLVKGEGDAQKTKDEFFERALYQAACKASIKAGRVYDEAHIKWICDRVFTLDNIKYCPHGRPVAFEITKHYLEKQFERIK